MACPNVRPGELSGKTILSKKIFASLDNRDLLRNIGLMGSTSEGNNPLKWDSFAP